MTWIEVGNKQQGVSVIIYDRALMEQQKPGFSTANPHIMFPTNDAQAEYDRIQTAGVEVFEWMEMPYGTMFQFKDLEGNDYVVRQD